jgi:hypothetical protein
MSLRSLVSLVSLTNLSLLSRRKGGRLGEEGPGVVRAPWHPLRNTVSRVEARGGAWSSTASKP